MLTHTNQQRRQNNLLVCPMKDSWFWSHTSTRTTDGNYLHNFCESVRKRWQQRKIKKIKTRMAIGKPFALNTNTKTGFFKLHNFRLIWVKITCWFQNTFFWENQLLLFGYLLYPIMLKHFTIILRTDHEQILAVLGSNSPICCKKWFFGKIGCYFCFHNVPHHKVTYFLGSDLGANYMFAPKDDFGDYWLISL